MRFSLAVQADAETLGEEGSRRLDLVSFFEFRFKTLTHFRLFQRCSPHSNGYRGRVN